MFVFLIIFMIVYVHSNVLTICGFLHINKVVNFYKLLIVLHNLCDIQLNVIQWTHLQQIHIYKKINLFQMDLFPIFSIVIFT